MHSVATQADILAIEAQGLPRDLPDSTYEMICRSALASPNAPALTFYLRSDYYRESVSWNYAELVRDITRTANLFHRLGVTHDSVVAYVLPNLPETHLTIWGGEAAGIVCAINPMLEGPAIAELLNASGATVLVTLGPFPGTDQWVKLQPELHKVTALKHLVLVDMLDRMTDHEREVAQEMQIQESLRLYGSAGVRSAVPADVEIHDFWKSVIQESGDALQSQRKFSSEDLSSYFCTGGTTGLPKIAMRRHGNEVANAASAGLLLGDSIGPGKTVFCGLPLFHVNAAMVTGLLPFSKGAHVVLGTPLGYRGAGSITHFWEIVAHYRINFFSAVPTVYASLLDVPVADHDISSLEYGLCGAAPMPVEVLRTFQQRTGIKILEGYGLTEGACISSVNPPQGDRRLGSIGLRLPFQTMKPVLLDEAGGYIRDCAVGEVGVLTIAGPNVFAGYSQPQQNEGIWIDQGDGQRHLNTGDLGRVDEDGYFWLTGRKKELIIRGGHNIDPAAIEEPLHRHPAVQVAAAVGRPDMHAGELPVVYVQLKPGRTASPAALEEFLRAEIAERAALPKQIHIIERMPLTAVGKIFKPELKRRETVDALRAALAEHGIVASVSIVEVRDGNVLHVELADHGMERKSAEILGRFPFAFSITQASQSDQQPA
ncbi:MAG: acyl-CoA synthetase [Burkholderiales bacterium]|nr:acyl-CoA synthetase [Burkholderiales bacterium]